MKYCIKYKRRFKYIKEIDELNIDFRPNEEALAAFIQNNIEKRINIFIDEADFIENDRILMFERLTRQLPEADFALVLHRIKDNEVVQQAYKIICNSQESVKYFFYDMVTDWDTLWGYMQYKPCDMYIAESLGFEIDRVAEVLGERGIRVRVYANVAQSPWKTTNALRKFFIRPEDVFLYEPYVDVIEFFGKERSLETLYKIYAVEHKWFGPLKELIIDFDSDIDNRYIIPSFGRYRLKCGKRCLKGRGCRICDATQQLSETLKENNFVVKTEVN